MSHTLYISVEKVPPTKPATILLGVSLTVLPGSPPLSSELARPWTWQKLAWSAWQSPDGTTWTPVNAAKISLLPVPAADKPHTPDPWRKALEIAIGQIKNPTFGTPNTTTKIIIKDDGTTPGDHQYLALLNNVAAGAYPIPQNLNLSLFLELSGIAANATQFLAAPSFTADGATIEPTSNLPAPVESSMWDVTGANGTMKMLSWFSDPETEFPSLWVKPPVKNTNATLVSDWTANLYQLIGPCLDLPHVLLNADKAQLKSSLPDPSKDWPDVRRWIIAGLYDLITSGLPTTVRPIPSMDSWCSLLKTTLEDSSTKFPDLAPGNSVPPRTFDNEIDELQKIVSTATSGNKLTALVQALYGDKIQDIPRAFLQADNTSALLQWLETSLALPYAKQIADACAATPGNYDTIAAALVKTVISPYLTRVPSLLAGTTMSPALRAITDNCVDSVKKTLAKALSVRAKGDDGSSWPATSSAPPLVIPVMRLTSNEDLKTDPLHGIRGVGVLIRRQTIPAMDWNCPNIVSAVGDTSRPLLVASRLGYNQKLLTGFLLYDNGPIPCENLLHNYLQKSDRLTSIGANLIDAIFRYAPYEGADLSFYGTPMLESGKSFEIICFAVSNAGAVPVELRDAYPAKLKVPHKDGALPGSPLLQIIRYYRTVPVGAVETRDAQGDTVVDSAGLFPRIPPSVRPRSIETVVPRIGVGLQASVNDLTSAKPATLMVVPTESNGKKRASGTVQKFTFSLNLPFIEPLTWDRTVGYQKDPIVRAQILDGAYSNLSTKKAAEITDPLITHVDLVIYRWEGVAGSETWTAVTSKVTFTVDSLRKGGVSSVSTFPILVAVDAGTGKNDGSVKVAIVKNGLPQTLAAGLGEGEVYLLEAAFRLDNSVTTIMQNYPKTVTAFQLLIEIASAKMPLPAELSKPFSFSRVPLNNLPDQKIVVELKTDSSPVWRNVDNAEFLRQSWYWTGRTQPKPFSTSVQLKDAFDNNMSPGYYPASESEQSESAQAWAMVEFAERPWTDHIILPAVRKGKAFHWEQDMSLDSRAAYLRFAPRVYSRYEGAFDDLAPQGVTTIGNGGNDVWQPCFLRSRVRRLDMPRLKSLIPFTESAFAPGTPGILAVFDGPAYDQAGLAERLQVRVAEVNDPESSAPKAKWQQQGPDFLMNSEMADPSQQVEMKLAAIGPIGHTLDSAYSSFPKFISHSWIIRPVNPTDDSNPDPGRDFSWWFANLEFQLSIDDSSSVFKDVGITSQETVGSWIQFLPGFQDSKHRANHFVGWTLEWADNIITIRDGSGKLVTHAKENERHTRHYLLVTRTVLDVTGKKREAYLGLAAASDGKWLLFPETANKITKDSQLRGRFLDIRAGEIESTNKPAASDAEFWQRILGQNNKVMRDEDRASIISLSPVVRQKGGSQ